MMSRGQNTDVLCCPSLTDSAKTVPHTYSEFSWKIQNQESSRHIVVEFVKHRQLSGKNSNFAHTEHLEALLLPGQMVSRPRATCGCRIMHLEVSH